MILEGKLNRIRSIYAVYLGLKQLSNKQLIRVCKWKSGINLSGSIADGDFY